MRAPRPRFVLHEEGCHLRYRHRVDTPAGPVRFRRSRWEHFHYGPDEGRIRHRGAAAWLYAGAERIALLQVEEFDPNPDTYWKELWFVADGLSAQAGDFVEALREAFGGSFANAADWGSIVLLSHAWVAPAHRCRLDQRAMLDALLPKMAPEYGIAVLVAHPEGFDDDEDVGAEHDNIEALGSFEWRQRALMRLYERKLGFTPLQVREARPEVMWRGRPDIQKYVQQRLDEEREEV